MLRVGTRTLSESTELMKSTTKNATSSSGVASNARSCGIGCIVEELYNNFNRCDADGTAACFTEDVVYEDLILGGSTIVESREDFRELIKTHPVFVGRSVCDKLQIPPVDIQVVVDSIAEDPVRRTIGVEWHVEVSGEPLALGRGLSHMRICPKTGLIQRAVDLVEAPWRAIGLGIAPFARSIRGLARLSNYAELISTVGILLGLLIFSDRRAMDEIRKDVDSLANFRDSLDGLSAEQLVMALGNGVTRRLLWVDVVDM